MPCPPDTGSQPCPCGQRLPEQRLVGVLALVRLQLLMLLKGPRTTFETALCGKGQSVSLEKSREQNLLQTRNAVEATDSLPSRLWLLTFYLVKLWKHLKAKCFLWGNPAIM